MLFVEAPRSVEELRLIGQSVRVPLVANMVEGGATPLVPAADLAAMGFKPVLHAGAPLRAAVKAVPALLAHLRQTGSTLGAEERRIWFQERNRVTGLAALQAWEEGVADGP